MNNNEQSPREPISLCDPSGKTIGTSSPAATAAQDDFFDEGSPGFFRELERRQNSELISVEEFFRYLKNGTDGK